MIQEFTNQDGNIVLLKSKPFANPGGEGAIYDVIEETGTKFDLVAKIYHTKKMADARQEKIEFMHANNPTEKASAEIKKAIIWIEDLLYRNDQFVGFTMQKVTEAISLKSLTLSSNPSKKHGQQWQKFDHDQLGAHQKRLVVAYNLAQAVKAIHERGNYVLVDMKPENIFVREDASIAIIDLDSLQILNESLNFASPVFTEEYAPSEKHKGFVNHLEGRIGAEWDYFSLAIIIYELLFGIHPFQASHQNYTTRPELIKEGLFVHGRKQSQLHKIPSIHQNFDKLAPQLQQLFHQTFDRGYLQVKDRVKPKRWAEVLLPEVNNLSIYSTVMDFSALVPVKKTKSTVEKAKKASPKIVKPPVKKFRWYTLSSFRKVIIQARKNRFNKQLITGTVKKRKWYHFTKRQIKTFLINALICLALIVLYLFLEGWYGPITELPVRNPTETIVENPPINAEITTKREEKKTIVKNFDIPDKSITKGMLPEVIFEVDMNGEPLIVEEIELRNIYQYLRKGLSEYQVVDIQGYPDQIINEGSNLIYIYGMSEIHFSSRERILTNYKNIGGNLKFPGYNPDKVIVDVVPIKEVFKIGDKFMDVLKIQGQPSVIKPNKEGFTYVYGRSEIIFKNNKVFSVINKGDLKFIP